MASITLNGLLLDPSGEFAVGDEIRFTHKSTTGSTIKSSVSTVTVDPSGSYSLELQYGLVSVDYKDSIKNTHTNLGVVTVNQDSTATTIPELLNSIVPPTDDQLLEFQSILADCVDAKVGAEQAAIEADNSALFAESAPIYLTLEGAKNAQLNVGKYVRITDRDNALGLVQSTGSANDRDIIELYNGNKLAIQIEGECLYVKHYGAVGNGTKDDTLAIQTALSKGQGKKIVCGPGQFLISDTLRMRASSTLSGGVPGIGTSLTRGCTLLADPTLQGYMLVGEKYQIASDNYLHGVKVEDIQFRGVEGVSGQDGFLYSAAGDGSQLNRCRFHFLDNCIDIINLDDQDPPPIIGTGPQVSTNVENCSFYYSETGIRLQNVFNMMQFKAIMSDRIKNPLVLTGTGSSMNASIDGWHIENIVDTTDLVTIDDCQGTLTITNVDCDINDQQAIENLFHIGPVQTNNRFRLLVESFRCTADDVYFLLDEVDDYAIKILDMGSSSNSYSLRHNLTDLQTGRTESIRAGFWKDEYIKASNNSKYYYQGINFNSGHDIGMLGGSTFSGIRFRDANADNWTSQDGVRAGIYGTTAKTEFTLYNANSKSTDASTATTGAFFRLDGNNATLGNRNLVGNLKINVANANTAQFDIDGTFKPLTNGAQNLGSSSLRWSEVFSVNGAINTSDERLKEFESIEEAERQCAIEIKSNIKKFKWTDEIEKKGDKARIHFGVGAQTVRQIFKSYGLDPDSYSLFCYDEWGTGIEHHEAVYNDDGVIEIDEWDEVTPAGSCYGIRYTELSMFILAAI